MQLTVPLSPLRRLLFTTWAFFVVAGYTVEILHRALGLEPPPAWVELLSLSYEDNIPTWYSSCVLFACSAVLAGIAARPADRRCGHAFFWWLLSAGFCYISLDESVSLHEQMNLWFSTGGVLYYGWVIPAAALVLVLGLVFLKFLFALPWPSRRRFIVAGVIYVTGALLMELPLGLWVEKSGSEHNLGYALIDGIEESMELLGSSLFLLALLQHVEAEDSPGGPGGAGNPAGRPPQKQKQRRGAAAES